MTNFKIIFTSLDGMTYNNAKIGQSDGSVGGTSIAFSLPGDQTDPRLIGFRDNRGFSKIDMCNRSGQPGTVGVGAHYIMGVPLPGSQPAESTQLSTIANPYAAVSFSGLLYIAEFDTPVIQAVDLCSYNIVLFGDDEDPAFTFVSPSTQGCGVDLEMVIEGYDQSGRPIVYLYALFANGNSFAGPWQNSSLVRLEIDSNDATRGRLIQITALQTAGPNATTMVQVRGYTPLGTSTPKNYLLVSAIGGTQNPGSGNGAASVISVFETGSSFNKVADSVNGTYDISGLDLDLKGIAATPLVSNGGYLFVIAGSYNSNYQTSWTVRQIKISSVIEKAIDIQSTPSISPYNLGDNDFTIVFPDTQNTPGYFWTVVFAPSGTGFEGTLVIGCGSSTGDQLRIYSLASTGVISYVTTLDYNQLYGTSGAVLNTMILVSTKGFGEDWWGITKAKTLVSSLPYNVANGQDKAEVILAAARSATVAN